MKLNFLILFSILLATSLCAQKVPNTQSKSIWAGKLKIDGKLDDWGKELSAYNKENKLWYSVSNDKAFLYLAVKKDKFPTKAYARGGIKLFISTKEVKSTNGLSAITFPVAIVNGKASPKEDWNEMDIRNIPGITDTLISIYNEHGIQIAFNLEDAEKGPVYTYELAIPLKLVGVSAGQTIYYNMLLRGNAKEQLSPVHAAMFSQMSPKLNPHVTEEMIQRMIDSGNWSDFWGSYKLASKP